MSDTPALSKEQRIWQVCQLVPAGKVVSYGQLADLAGLPGRARLAGKALRLTPDTLTLPWHRVVNAAGKISLPPGSPGFQEQQYRLREEGVMVRNGRVKMSEYQWQPDLAELLWQLPF
ncbi:MGMT family protein [Ferrimonas kyonanensis]|uniref:MGMT family protein n=1 Tax=Ferrimonas kyonanensis TaxID=364763 RepID=UPI0004154A6A|nr:methylated-DNA--[protein]-cysteine S-methyltransferase [Ferrimonas kyonanensis]